MLLTKNGRVMDPKSGLTVSVRCWWRARKLSKSLKSEAADAQVLDASGLVVASGLVDIHVHFGAGPDLAKKTLARGAPVKGSGRGFTTVVMMATNPTISQLKPESAESVSRENIHIKSVATITENLMVSI